EEAATVPSLFGLPRYQFRRQMVNLGRWAGYVLRRDRGRAFVYELKLIRWASVLYHSAAPHTPSPRPLPPMPPLAPAPPLTPLPDTVTNRSASS
ncbi:MAG: hypothetical protein ACRCZF_13130, partial [Gemmataceae bacterium]